MKTTTKKAKPKKAASELGRNRTRTQRMDAKVKNPGGRPSVFDDAAPKLIAAIRDGNTYACASGCARISYGTFNCWMKEGEQDIEQGVETKFSKFFHDVKEAEKACELEVLGYWKKEMPGNWKACQEYLARRHYSEWGSKDKVDVTSNGESIGKPVFLPMKKYNDEKEA